MNAGGGLGWFSVIGISTLSCLSIPVGIIIGFSLLVGFIFIILLDTFRLP